MVTIDRFLSLIMQMISNIFIVYFKRTQFGIVKNRFERQESFKIQKIV